MARTKGSGWGGGTIFYQKCPKCGRKKAMYDPMPPQLPNSYKCTWCKERFTGNQINGLQPISFVSQIERRKTIDLKSAN